MLFVGYVLGLYPPPRMPVTNEGLGWDSLLKMVQNPGGHCYWLGGSSKVCSIGWKHSEMMDNKGVT